MSGAPYSIDANFTDDETIQFALYCDASDGTPLPLAGLTVEYVVRDAGGAEMFRLTEGAGITIDRTLSSVAFKAAAGRLAPGRYTHGGRFVLTATNEPTQLFDGTLRISEGNF